MISILTKLVIFSLVLIIAFRCVLSGGALSRLPELFSPGTPTMLSASPSSIPMWKVFLSAVGFRILILAAALTSIMLLSNSDLTLQQCVQQFQRWDALHYINLIEKGYANYIEDGQHIFLVFFPAYVWAVRLLTCIIPNTVVAGTLFSCLCYAWGCCFVYKLAKGYFNARVARDSLIYLSLYPFSFFYSAVMTEGLFLLTTSAACYYAWKKNWVLFSLFGFFAALTRMLGILVVVFAVVVFIDAEKPFAFPLGNSICRTWKLHAKRIPFLIAPILGTSVYLLLNYAVDGDPFAFVIHQRHWNQGFTWIAQVINYTTEYLMNNISNSLGWAVQLPTLIIFICAIILLFVSSKRTDIPTSLLAYSLCYLIANYSLSWLLSAGRYMSCCFPLFIIMAKYSERRPFFRIVTLMIQSIFLGIYLCAYTSGAPVM